MGAGAAVGSGAGVGSALGSVVGSVAGAVVGSTLGWAVGSALGSAEGSALGSALGAGVGSGAGSLAITAAGPIIVAMSRNAWSATRAVWTTVVREPDDPDMDGLPLSAPALVTVARRSAGCLGSRS